MAYNFLASDRDQPFLLPPDVRDWLTAGHSPGSSWTWSTSSTWRRSTRTTATTGTATRLRPKALLAVLLDGYAIGVRSSRQVERRLTEDIAFRVLAANQAPDHVTIARFRVRHEQALAGFLVESLKLCAAAGLVRLGLVALDGTKVAANAAERANRTHQQLEAEVAEILRQAAEADQREDQLLCGTHNLLKLWRHQTAQAARHAGRRLSREQARHGRRGRTNGAARRRGAPRFARPPATCSCRL